MSMDLYVSRVTDKISGHSIEVTYVDNDGVCTYAIRDNFGMILNHHGEWEQEPSPSSRNEDFLQRCRYDSFQSAVNALNAHNQTENNIDHKKDSVHCSQVLLEKSDPELPPIPPYGSGLPRYGISWNSPEKPLTIPMHDGYWTPWHLAHEVQIDSERYKKIASQYSVMASEGLYFSLDELRDHDRTVIVNMIVYLNNKYKDKSTKTYSAEEIKLYIQQFYEKD